MPRGRAGRDLVPARRHVGARRHGPHVLRSRSSASRRDFLGALAAGSLIAGLRFLIPRTRNSGERAWWPVFGVLAVVGFMFAFGFRIMTARVGGANIGGGLFLMFGLPVMGVLVLWALARAWNLSAPPDR